MGYTGLLVLEAGVLTARNPTPPGAWERRSLVYAFSRFSARRKGMVGVMAKGKIVKTGAVWLDPSAPGGVRYEGFEFKGNPREAQAALLAVEWAMVALGDAAKGLRKGLMEKAPPRPHPWPDPSLGERDSRWEYDYYWERRDRYDPFEDFYDGVGEEVDYWGDPYSEEERDPIPDWEFDPDDGVEMGSEAIDLGCPDCERERCVCPRVRPENPRRY